MIEFLDTGPNVDVQESEYRRLLGYPTRHVPGERAVELSRWAREWYAANGHPWVYAREAAIDVTNGSMRIDGVGFQSGPLRERLVAANSSRGMLVVASAGAVLETMALELWEQGRPDEYFFLEIFGSAVVEHLVAMTSGRLCALAEQEGMVALPHSSPGYPGWDVAEQGRLFEVINARRTRPLPEDLRILSSGMPRPKKSLLAVFGLSTQRALGLDIARHVPCESCSLTPCQYRRVPYRHARTEFSRIHAVPQSAGTDSEAPPRGRLSLGAKYRTGLRALEKWARERVELKLEDDQSIKARFRFDGTTCSNMGHPLAFDYLVTLGPPADDFVIREATCRPAPGDTGHMQMCAFLGAPAEFTAAIAAGIDLVDRPLEDILTWQRPAIPSACYCDPGSRLHKWGLALEAIHYAVARWDALEPTSNEPAPVR